MAKEHRLPSIWRSFSDFPSFFDAVREWFPEQITFSHNEGLSISETDDSILVEAAAPGLKSEDIDISLDKGVLWIKGQKSEIEEDKERKYYRKASTSYSYCTPLPESTDVNVEPEATCEDGVVKIKFKKKESTKPKKIEIKKG